MLGDGFEREQLRREVWFERDFWDLVRGVRDEPRGMRRPRYEITDGKNMLVATSCYQAVGIALWMQMGDAPSAVVTANGDLILELARSLTRRHADRFVASYVPDFWAKIVMGSGGQAKHRDVHQGSWYGCTNGLDGWDEADPLVAAGQLLREAQPGDQNYLRVDGDTGTSWDGVNLLNLNMIGR